MTKVTLDFATSTAFINNVKLEGKAFDILVEGISNEAWAAYDAVLWGWHRAEMLDNELRYEHGYKVENEYLAVFVENGNEIDFHDLVYKGA